jgi:hypothetical protein
MNVVAREILDGLVEKIYENYPELLEKYGEAGKVKCREDVQHHFRNLDVAFQLNHSKIFIDYSIWLNNVLTSRGMKTEHIIDNFQKMQEVLHEPEFAGKAEFYHICLSEAIQALNQVDKP